jgi:hypothetical protein
MKSIIIAEKGKVHPKFSTKAQREKEREYVHLYCFFNLVDKRVE